MAIDLTINKLKNLPSSLNLTSYSLKCFKQIASFKILLRVDFKCFRLINCNIQTD